MTLDPAGRTDTELAPPDQPPPGQPPAGTDTVPVQRRTLRVLFASQILGGVGVGTAAGVGTLVVADISGSDALAGLAGTATTLGGALAAYPMASIMARRGRRPGLFSGYLIGIVGAAAVVLGAVTRSLPVVLIAMLLFGSANATNLQARYAATDLATPQRRSRSLSFIVWATTVGAVAGPNLLAPSSSLGRGLGIPALAGPFLFSAVAFAVAIVVLIVGLRPDPLLLRLRIAREASGADAVRAPEKRLWSSLAAIARNRLALVGLIGMVAGQVAMTGVMSMTPVHMRHTEMGTLQIIGIVISLHIAGMYALSPLVGLAADRLGNLRVLMAGPVVLWISALVAGFAPMDSPAILAAGLFLLGLGWSVCLVAGSSLLTASLPEADRARAQGAADLTMGLLGAAGGALAGVVQDLFGYGRLNAATAALLLVAVVWGAALLTRHHRSARPSEG